MKQSVVVVIATIGNGTVARAVESVLAQDHGDVRCLVVVDGREYEEKARKALGELVARPSVDLMVLPQNTGRNGFVCHRIYSAMPLIVNEDFVCYLDDDNWFERSHVSGLVSLINAEGLQWSYSFRNILSEAGDFICRDECESLGVWPVWYNPSVNHVDTNCYCLTREAAIAVSGDWHRSRFDRGGNVLASADTFVCRSLLVNFPKVRASGKFTVNYVLGSWELSPKPEFFLKGNIVYLSRYPGGLPWAVA